MAKITANGTFHGVMTEVTCTDGEDGLVIDFDDQENGQMESIFRRELGKGHAMGGSFHPERESMLNALNVIRHYFFDDEPEIQIDGDIGEIPTDPDSIF